MPSSFIAPATAATACFISSGPIAPMQPTRNVSSWVSLPGIEDEAARLDRLVERLELVARIGRRVEGEDDRRLDLRVEEGLEAERRPFRHERRAVRRVARQPRRLAALLDELAHSLGERCDDVGRWREAPLAGLFHVDVLVVQVHRQRVRVAGRGGHRLVADEDEAHSRHAFETLAAGGDERVETDLARIDRQRRERAHRVDDEALAVARAHVGDGLQRVEHAGAGLAVDEADVGDAGVGAERLVELVGRDRRVLGVAEDRRPAPHQRREPAEPLAVGAVVEHEDVAVLRHDASRPRLRPRRCRCPAAARRRASLRRGRSRAAAGAARW